ncbi:hypothetical protein V7146_00455 [Gottfriedia acidiceleris]|nr:hypothetical protein [Bacillus sp. AFS053548]
MLTGSLVEQKNDKFEMEHENIEFGLYSLGERITNVQGNKII